MATCQHCGAWVTDDWARVFAADDGTLWFCPECTPLHGGAEPGEVIRARRAEHA